MAEQDEEEFNAASSIGDCDYLKTTKDIKFPFPKLMETQVRKLRQSMEGWKEFVLPIKNVILWRKHWYPTAIAGAVTVVFMLLWLLDPSLLTIISLLGLIITICDYLGPSFIISILRCDEPWNASKDRELDDICTNIILFKTKCGLVWDSYFSMKETKPKLYYIITICILSLLVYIGCAFNNLFLFYLLTITLLLAPGMEHNGILSKGTEWMFHTLQAHGADFSKTQSVSSIRKNE